MISWKYSENNVATGKNVNVAVATYVITQSRLKLYEYLSKMGDSVIYIQNLDEQPKVERGYYLGDHR